MLFSNRNSFQIRYRHGFYIFDGPKNWPHNRKVVGLVPVCATKNPGNQLPGLFFTRPENEEECS